MSEWKKVKFLDVVHLNPRISLEKGVEYPFVEMSNVVPCARKPEKDVFKKYLGEGTKFEQGDTIVARIEPCLQNGKGFQCSYKQGFGSTEFLVFRPVNINDLDCDFLYYYMGQQSIREAMAKTMVGASGRQRVNNKVFNDLQINLPPLSTQHRIATILSRYDSLIENYQKQIKLLEEAAQRLYKEWFVDLRFPGHENTKIVDGLPEGWERKKLGDLFSFVRGKSYTSKELSDDGTIMVNLKNIQSFGGYKSDVEKHFIGTFKEEQTLMKGDLIMGVTDMTQERRLVGSVALIPDFKETATFSMDLIKLVSHKLPNVYLYCAMRYGDISRQIAPLANGVNVLHLKPESINNIEMLVASESIIDKFARYTSKTIEAILSLQSQLRLLAEARDRLLPKLMSGEITV